MTHHQQHLGNERQVRRRNRIVVGIDGSPCSLAALQWAAAEADSHEAELVVIHAWRLPSVGLPGLSPPYDKEGFEAHARSIVDAAIAAVPEASAAKAEIVEARAVTALVEASREASLLVVGSHGHEIVPGVMLGSVSHHVAMHALCPVVIIRMGH
jgi:nucleotide-binding universal stress UspA family protein